MKTQQPAAPETYAGPPDRWAAGPLSSSDRVARLAVLVACASVLQVAETLLPYPLPGIRLGLANIITLIALVETGPADAFRLALLRSLTSSFVLGTFLSPSFVLSFSGALVSAGLMVLLFRITTAGSWVRFSFIGISVAGSVAHVLAQLGVVYVLFIRSAALLALWPVLAVSGVVMGVLTGVAAGHVCRRLGGRTAELAGDPQITQITQIRPTNEREEQTEKGEDTVLRRVKPEVKIAVVLVVALAVVLVRSWWLYAGVLLFLLVAALVSRVGFRPLFHNLRRLAVFTAAAFLAPALFTPGATAVLALGPVRITSQGLENGAVFASRVALLFFATALLALTTRPEAVAAGLEKILSPLKLLGVSTPRLARTLSLSWSFFPKLWDRARQMVRGRQKRGWSAVTDFLPDLVAKLYVEAERLARGRPEAE